MFAKYTNHPFAWMNVEMRTFAGLELNTQINVYVFIRREILSNLNATFATQLSELRTVTSTG